MLVFNKSLWKAADTGVGETECASGLLATTWLSNACSNSGKGVGISPLETAAVYLKKYIDRLLEGVGVGGSSILATDSNFFSFSYPANVLVFLCTSPHGCWEQASKGDFNFQ